MRDIANITHFYFIGIGGIGMSALARYLRSQGKQVAGYDRTVTRLSRQLEQEGIDIHYDSNFDKIPSGYKNKETAQVIYTPAVPLQFEELVRFRESDVPIIKRAQLLGQISRTMTCLAIAGTHGKTTTSAILAHLMYQSDVKTTAFLGGILQGYRTNYLNSGTDVMVVEADEFDRSFLQLQPDYAAITAMDADHLDIYGSEEEFQKTFKDFSDLLDPEHLFVTDSVSLSGVTVGVDKGTYRVENLKIIDGAYHFDLITPIKKDTGWQLRLPGRHNLSNAILAVAMADSYGVPLEKLRQALATFAGVVRRFTYALRTEHYVVIDDYAHHPTEINAVYQAVSEMYPGEPCTVIFQPHLFSRTRDFMAGFASSLSQFDTVGLLEIYPAREAPIAGINSDSLCQLIKDSPDGPGTCKVLSKDDIATFAQQMGNRIVLLIGAGDIGVEVDVVCKGLAR